MLHTKGPKSNLLLTSQEPRGKNYCKSIIIVHSDKFYKREILSGQVHGGGLSKLEGWIQDWQDLDEEVH